MDCTICVEDSTVTVRGVLAETHVASDVDVWEEGPNLKDGLDNRALRVICWCSTSVLVHVSIGSERDEAAHFLTLEGDTKEDDAAKTFLDERS